MQSMPMLQPMIDVDVIAGRVELVTEINSAIFVAAVVEVVLVIVWPVANSAEFCHWFVTCFLFFQST